MALPQSFGCGLVQASFVTSSGLLNKVWSVISSRDKGIVSYSGNNGLFWKVSEDSGLTVVAFEVNPGFDLLSDFVSSSYLKKNNFNHFEFLCTKKNPDFSVNKSAVDLFSENLQRLDELKSKIDSSPRLIVTGYGVGGPIASLFTLSLLGNKKKKDDKKKSSEKKKPPLCITFGSPLVGNNKFQEAISRSSTWSSCFLHVVSIKDPVPKRLNPQTSAYMPFGTFLFCSDINSTCFENPESVLEILVSSINDQNQGFQPKDYSNIVLWEAGLTPDMQQQHLNIDINALVTKLEELENKFIYQKRVKFYPSKKLNVMKIEMSKLGWYKRYCKNHNIGYYDSFKRGITTSDLDAIQCQQSLRNYWIDMVEEAEMKPQTEGAAFCTRWLFGGTNYKRMVEPLDIADYYRSGGKDYVAKGRSRHYIVLEEWLEEEKKDTSDSNSTNKKNVESILTFDSCFWAHVEEAILSCKVLEDVQSSVTEKEEETGKLLEFEKYVYGLLTKYEVSSEIFLEHSSYMTWWNQYKAIKNKETSYNSALADFMSNPDYYNVQYAKGTYNFLPGA
ncbi:hypothetical protein GLYMA_13G069000v4 [Glycine max]|nr:hypothetical protein GLYMA_13G069000v4 [Glycine max]KAH1100199.1 hypothetical protein GYH30_035383 [Glycine max]